MYSCERLPVEIAGVGAYVPDRVLTNRELEEMVETSDEWIMQRTGIRTRHILADDQATSHMAIAAARRALETSDVEAAELELIIVATLTSDYIMPATACLLQDALGAAHAMAFDLEAACSGFVFGLASAASMIIAGLARNALVIGAEALSRVTDYTDRRSCILFGDAAGAAVLRPARDGGEFIYCEMGADGSNPDVLILPAGGSLHPATHETVERRDHYVKLQGREVFKRAVVKLGELLQNMPERTGIPLSDIKVVVPHQSNFRIIKAAFERVGLDLDKAYMNIERVGNTSSASIPLAMADAIADGTIERGDLILLLAFGGGLTWGATLLRY